MAVKKGILDNFLKPSSHYNENQKNLGSIFINDHIQENSGETTLNSETKDIASPSPFDRIINQLPSFKIDIHKEIKKIDNEIMAILKDVKPLKPLETIGKQLVNNRETIGKQLVNNWETIGKQKINKEIDKETNRETIGKPIGKPNRETIGKQLVNQLVNNQNVSTLTGLQREILFYIVEDCIDRGQLTSGLITNQTFREITKSNAKTVKTSVQRLIKKGVMNRNPNQIGKRGKGGFSSFIITEQIRDDVLKEKRKLSIGKQLVNQLVNDIGKQLVNNKETNRETNTSSSSLDIKNTTTELSEDWLFDITPYKKFGFTSVQIKQLAKLGTLSAAKVEQSLIEFTFDLDNDPALSKRIKTTKVNYLMGLLREGESYISEGYRNEQQQEIAEMARRAEDKRKRLLEEEFLAWVNNLSDEEAKEIESKMPRNILVSFRALGLKAEDAKIWLATYFQEQKLSNPVNI